MAGRTPSEAFREFRELIQEAISCFAHTRVAGTSQEPNEHGILTVNRGKPLSLKAAQRQVDITCSISYKIHQDDAEHRQWKVSTLGYIHTVTLDEELFVDFHWHPDDGSNVWYPHIHPRFAGSGKGSRGHTHPVGTNSDRGCSNLCSRAGCDAFERRLGSCRLSNQTASSCRVDWGSTVVADPPIPV